MPTPEEQPKDGELMEKREPPATLDSRRDRCSLDDAYIFNYTQNPKAGKSAALRAAGFQGEHVRQEAYRMHNRLRLKIQAVTAENMRDLAALSVDQLADILNSTPDEIGTANMLAAIKLGKDFSNTTPQPPEDIPQSADPDARRRRIETLQKQIREKTGRALPAPA